MRGPETTNWLRMLNDSREDDRTSIEREEDEWVRRQVLLQPFVQEAVGIEL
jgi:hypothetical protein